MLSYPNDNISADGKYHMLNFRADSWDWDDIFTDCAPAERMG